MYIQQLSMPFSFLSQESLEIDEAIIEREGLEIYQEKLGDHSYFSQEKELEKRFDKVVDRLYK
jgi:hypothetical protein